MRVALIHDWLVTWRGGERVLEALASLYPKAPIFTLFHDPRCLPPSLRDRELIAPKWLQRFKRARKAALPIYPAIVESFDLRGYDLVISSSSCVAKGVIPAPRARHLCYLHSPMRYLWDQREEYLAPLGKIPLARAAVGLLGERLRLWDTVSAARVDRFVVNSSFVGARVERYYRRESVVIPPPIDVRAFTPGGASQQQGGYFLAAGAFVPYKRFDLAILAAQQAGVRLIIAGSGPEEKRLRALAGPSTTFEISPDHTRWSELLRGARALLFPQVEDFGMVAIEAMASGTPVIAYRDGGALDFIKEGRTGVFFDHPDPSTLARELSGFNDGRFDIASLRAYAEEYDTPRFLDRMRHEIQQTLGRNAP
jgi:glycosyltransferase involved in cell wall biosynthesis